MCIGSYSIPTCILTISCLLLFKVVDGGTWCKGTVDDVYKTQYCDVGGCCIGDGSKWYKNNDADSDLCCISTLTVVLIAIFIGGPVLLMVCICTVCCVKWCIKRKNKRITRIGSGISDDEHMDPKELRLRARLANADLMLPAYTPNPPPYVKDDEAGPPGSVRSPPPAYTRPDTSSNHQSARNTYTQPSTSARNDSRNTSRNSYNQPSTSRRNNSNQPPASSRTNYNQPPTSSRNNYNQPSTSQQSRTPTNNQKQGKVEHLQFI